jgi:PAS domain S-box-containing protein
VNLPGSSTRSETGAEPALNPHIVVVLSQFVSRLACAIVGCFGLLGLLGWIFDVELFKAPFSGEIGLKANTSIALTCSAISLAVLTRREGKFAPIAHILASAVLIIGALTFAEHLTNRDLGIDQLFFKEAPGAPATTSPGRMGPPASLGFALIGAALLMIDLRLKRNVVPSHGLALLVGLISLLPLIGYAYQIRPLYSISRLTGIAPQTAISLGLLAVGILCARPERGVMTILSSDGPGGEMARRLILPTIIIPFVLGLLRTLAQRQGWIDDAFGRPALVLSIIVIFTTLIWWNATVLERVGRERRGAQKALRESEQRFRVALQTAPVTVYTNDLDLRYTWIYNPRFGFTTEDIVGKRDEELRPYEAVAELIDLKNRVIQSRVGERRQLAIQYRGEEYFYDVCAEPLYDSSGNITGITVASMDVTAHKNIERELLRANHDADQARKVAEAANRAKDQFLAVLSHELRTPLTPVMTLVQMIEDDPALPAQVHEHLVTIRRNVELEVKLIDDLLDLTRVTRGKLLLHFEPLDIHDKLRHIVQICESDIRAKELHLLMQLNASNARVLGDPARLQQILWNLLKNSVKFTDPGGRIVVRTEERDGQVKIAVQDDGIGIDGEALPKIFNAFEQGNGQITQQFGGLGLGLTISKALVDMHGGKITAHSDGRGKGCTFEVSLPITSAQPDESPSRDSSGDGAASALTNLKILLVEDHPDTANAMARLLGGFGCQVRTANSIAAALEDAQSHKFDLLVSDLGLPDGSGLDLMRQLLSNQAVKGIALSGFGMDEDVRKSREAGFAVHLTKPVNLKELKETIEQVATRA